MLKLWDFKARQCNTFFVIFLLRCLKPLLPKFQRLSVVCLVAGDNTRTDFFPLVCLAKRFFTGVGFVAVDWLILRCITLYYPGSMRVFFGSKAAIAVTVISYLL